MKTMKIYYPRVSDKLLELKLRAFGGVEIVGPKWCGKTTSADKFSKSAIKLQKDPNKEALKETAKITPSVLLEGDYPRLIDEWQDAPTIWDAVRSFCDDNDGKGYFIMTGSTSKKVETSHTGTGRISQLRMYPMSLYESKESNGSVSLLNLFNNENCLDKGCVSSLEIKDLIFAACRGGWPSSVLIDDQEAQLLIAKDYFEQIYKKDMFCVDSVKRNSSTMHAILQSYGRNISTLAKKVNLINDVRATNNITEPTFDDYIDVLERLYIIDDLYGWCPAIRSAKAMRSGRKREFVDPSIAVAAIGASPSMLELDLKTFGFIFECLCIRDLRIYSTSLGGRISYYHDSIGLEADAVLHLDDGRYALIEFKLGAHQIDDGANHLCEIEKLIDEHNKKEQQNPLRKPSFKMIITGTQYGYKRADGVFVVPIGCLKD